jgi:hypothetical protein
MRASAQGADDSRYEERPHCEQAVQAGVHVSAVSPRNVTARSTTVACQCGRRELAKYSPSSEDGTGQ